MSRSYILGAVVKLPLQITTNAMAFVGDVSPKIEKIVKPNGDLDSSFPTTMISLDSNYSVYVYEYKPTDVGDYIVIFSFEIEGIEYTTMYDFTVSLGYSVVIPKAVPL